MKYSHIIRSEISYLLLVSMKIRDSNWLHYTCYWKYVHIMEMGRRNLHIMTLQYYIFWSFLPFHNLSNLCNFSFRTNHHLTWTKKLLSIWLYMSKKEIFRINVHTKHIFWNKRRHSCHLCILSQKILKKLRKSKITFPIGSFDCVKCIPRLFSLYFFVCIM